MHDRGRLDHDLDPVIRKHEEEVRLEHLESFVSERRGVDRDLRTHLPGWMRERIVRCYVFESGPVAAAERASRGGQHDRVDGLRFPAFEALEDGGVLTVDGQQAASTPPSGR